MDSVIVLALQEDPGSIATWYLPWCLLTFLVSLALSLLLTPVMIEAARKHSIVDYPDGGLKNHQEPTPYLGGLGI
jgi:UDP-N-acetylmuramyl pentapeptide phosphotransferase/UDP-N-acetylglucosamine-1-phosphate transferase